MTFASNLTRGLTLGALAMGLALPSVNAQNGSNYHVLSNGLDGFYGGVGAGGGQTKADGLGTWIPGEDLKGSHIVAFSGDFGYRNEGWRESACVVKQPISGALEIRFRGIEFIEFDGLNGNNPLIFTNPTCTNPSFPLGGSIGFIPYGTVPGTASVGNFVIAGLPAGVGPTASAAILIPNSGFAPSSVGGTATIIGAASNVALGIASSGFCWGVQFNWVPSALPLTDDIDGMWHYVINSDGNNQYWGFTVDEMNIWQSHSLNTDGGLTAFQAGFATSDYNFLLTTVEPNTLVALAPRGSLGTGQYYTQTENVGNQNGASVNPNGGFDVGRGSAAISFSGTAGVPNGTGVGNQNPANNPVSTLGTLGFATWDNGGDGDGSVRLTWISIDILCLTGGTPESDPGVTKFGGTIRLPVTAIGLLQGITKTGFNLFQHVTSLAPSGWPDPDGFASGAFGIIPIGGASWQLPTGPVPGACIGLPLNLTYGTTGRKGGVGTAGGLTFDPSIADSSGSKQLFLFN